MNASALLKSQGWRGKGHTLHATDNSIGLANPLLLSRNTDGSGIGAGANKQMTDQWWLNAFDEKLKGLDTSKKGVVVQSVTKGHLDIISSGGGKYSGLYLSFVKGGLMEGTLTPPEGESTDATPVSENGGNGPRMKETKAERRARKAAKIERRAARAAEKKRKEELKKIKEKAKKGEETKEERRARKAEAKARKEARRKRREEKAARKAG